MRRRQKGRLRRALERFVIHLLLAVLMVPVRLLPLRGVRMMARLLAWGIVLVFRRRQRLVDYNLRAVFGDDMTPRRRREVRIESVVNIAKTMGELLKLRWMSEEQVREAISIEGAEHLDAALARGKGVILVTAHFGNWEYAGALLALLGYPINVIARDAAAPFAADLINEARRSKGVQVFGRDDVRELLRALHRNECVAILPDQHAKDAPVRVRFLGRTADSATGTAVFALRTGAAVVPLFTYRRLDDHIVLRVFPAVEPTRTGDREADVVATTQRINDIIGEQIRAHPEQWLWLHDRWKAEADLGTPTS